MVISVACVCVRVCVVIPFGPTCGRFQHAGEVADRKSRVDHAQLVAHCSSPGTRLLWVSLLRVERFSLPLRLSNSMCISIQKKKKKNLSYPGTVHELAGFIPWDSTPLMALPSSTLTLPWDRSSESGLATSCWAGRAESRCGRPCCGKSVYRQQ